MDEGSEFAVNLQCHNVRWHHHLTGGLRGIPDGLVQMNAFLWRNELGSRIPGDSTMPKLDPQPFNMRNNWKLRWADWASPPVPRFYVYMFTPFNHKDAIYQKTSEN